MSTGESQATKARTHDTGHHGAVVVPAGSQRPEKRHLLVSHPCPVATINKLTPVSEMGDLSYMADVLSSSEGRDDSSSEDLLGGYVNNFSGYSNSVGRSDGNTMIKGTTLPRHSSGKPLPIPDAQDDVTRRRAPSFAASDGYLKQVAEPTKRTDDCGLYDSDSLADSTDGDDIQLVAIELEPKADARQRSRSRPPLPRFRKVRSAKARPERYSGGSINVDAIGVSPRAPKGQAQGFLAFIEEEEETKVDLSALISPRSNVSAAKLLKLMGEEAPAQQPPRRVESAVAIRPGAKHTRKLGTSAPSSSGRQLSKMERLMGAEGVDSISPPTSGEVSPARSPRVNVSAPSMGKGKLGKFFGTNSTDVERRRGDTVRVITAKTRGTLSVTLFAPELAESPLKGKLKGRKLFYRIGVLKESCEFRASTPICDMKPSSNWQHISHIEAELKEQVVINLVDKSDTVFGQGLLSLASLPLGSDAICTVDLGNSIKCRCVLLPIDFGVKSTKRSVANYPAIAAPNLLDVDVICGRNLPFGDAKTSVRVLLSYGEQSLCSKKLEAANCNPEHIDTDATFALDFTCKRLHLRLVTETQSGLVILGKASISLSEILWNAQIEHEGFWAPVQSVTHGLLDGTSTGFLKLRLQVSPPGSAASIHFSLGSPLRVLPIRLNYGDVILLNNPTAGGHLVSVATSSSWDHAAVVYQEENGQLMEVEATNEGVHGHELEERLKFWLNNCTKIGIRRLHLHRDEFVRLSLWQFSMEMCGRRYKKSVGQLVGGRLGINKSELVAAAFKHLGVISASKTASNFLPKDFAGSLKLEKGSLGDLVVLKVSIIRT